ncbi:MAG: hypothetical protein H6960_01555 [Chromatiaceae bacterium]|nr:hypothetical protein [Chromatiaceae bacterium]
MTGDEPGTCKSITGTPYAGAEQYRNHCRHRQSRGRCAHASQQAQVRRSP